MIRRIAFCAGFLIFFLSTLFSSGYAVENKTSATADTKDLFYVEAEGKGFYLDRSKKFGLIDVGNWTLGTIDSVIEFDPDAWMGGYKIAMGVAAKGSLYVEGSFEQSFASAAVKMDGLSAEATGNLAVEGFIDDNYLPTAKGFIVGAPLAGNSALSSFSLKYDFSYTSYRLNLAKKILDEKSHSIDLFAGPVYSRFTQHYRVSTVGTCPLDFIAPADDTFTTSFTSERLIDNLYGGSLGLRGKIRLCREVSIYFDEMADLFYRNSTLKATQDISNATNMIILANSFNGTITKAERDEGLVPHFASKIGLRYDIRRNISLNLFYQFDMWSDLTRIENPRVTADTLTSSGPVHIADNEHIISNAIGGSLLFEF